MPFPQQYETILKIAKNITNATPNEIRAAGLMLEQLALGQHLKQSPPDDRKALRDLYCAFETLLETEFAGHLISETAVPQLQSYSLWSRFQRLTRAELAGTKAQASDQLAFIGSGPFPVSAISYALQVNIATRCIDSDSSAVNTATKIVSRLNLSHQVKFDCQSGQDKDFGQFNIIVIAALAQPKLGILNRICKTAKPGTRIAFRTSAANCNTIYEDYDGPFPTRMSQYAHHHAGSDDTISCRFFSLQD